MAGISYDSLTGLLDYSGFQSQVREFLVSDDFRSRWLLFFNIENFKLVNSTLGTEAGDELLRYTGRLIQEAFHDEPCARIGEDRFAVLTSRKDMKEHILEIHEKVRSFHPSLQMLVKTGIYEVQKNDSSPLIMLDRARLACLSCKGRFDRVCAFYDPALSESLLTSKYIVSHVRTAIEQQYIRVYYQPLIRILSGRLCGLEALARWDDPEYGLLSPADFISILEDAHLIHHLDLYMAECVCRDIRRMLDRGDTVVPVSINLSRLDFDLCDMPDSIDEIVRRYDLSPQLLDIEITESALSEAGDSLKQSLQSFRNRGYRIWMDDFGSQYSSLNTLKDYDFNVLKIDMTFLSGFNDPQRSEKTKTIVRSVINMASELGIQTLCEGVETMEQLLFLRDSGCEIAQGFLFSKPLAIEFFYELPYVAETKADREYADQIGRVSLYSDHPLGAKHQGVIDAGLQPMAIFEYSGKTLKVLVMNSAFRSFLLTLGIPDTEDLNQFFNASYSRIAERLQRLADRCISSHSAEYADMVINGDYCNIQMYAISSNTESGRSALLVRALNVSRMSSYVSGGIKDKVLRSVYTLFERIDILDYHNDVFLNVFEGRGNIRGTYDSLPLQKALQDICAANIHPDDVPRFLELYNMKTLPERLRTMKTSFHVAMFRLKEPSGEYSWQALIQTIVMLDGRDVVLSLVTDGSGFLGLDDNPSPQQKPEMTGTSMVIREKELFESLIHFIPCGVFWKDENRRFLGANRYFLDFYGFLSDKDILGMTDEDMGWHVDPVPFMRNEEYVLEGHPVYNIEGSCIIRGQDHRIEASKFPIRRNGRVVGLIGYFRDCGINAPEADSGLTDPLTGLLNAQGAIAAFSRYKHTYLEQNKDFSIMSVDVVDFDSLNHTIGIQAANEVLVRIAGILISILGDDSVISRISADEFVILRQVTDAMDLVRDEYEIASAVSSIRTVSGLPVSVSVAVESMLYSRYRLAHPEPNSDQGR